MKKPGALILLIITVAILAFTLGFFFGTNLEQPATISVPPVTNSLPVGAVAAVSQPITQTAGDTVLFPININTATKAEFMMLPGIGDVLAERILAYRDSAGSFTTVEGLMNVDGIGEKRMEELLDLITIGGTS